MKEYLVTTIDRVRTIYVVPANSEEEAREKIEHQDQSYQIDQEEFYDRESIESVEENI